MKMHVATLVAAVLSMTAADVQSGEIIAHASVVLSIAAVREVYLGEQHLQGNVVLVPVNNAAAYAEFLGAVLQTDDRQYVARWRRKSLKGGPSRPMMLRSDAEVIEFVRATPGAVGYVQTPASGVKVLGSF